MTLLLDTHIWLWAADPASGLPSSMRQLLGVEGAERWVSPISAWEIVLLAEKGRIALVPDPHRWIEESWRAGGLLEAPLTIEVALQSRRVHRRPARALRALAEIANDAASAHAEAATFLATSWR